MSDRTGPDPRGGPVTARTQHSKAYAGQVHGCAAARLDGSRQDVPAQLRRRRDAANRLLPLDCGCRTRDPWLHRCRPSPPLSDRAVDGYAAAIRHLRDHGLLPHPFSRDAGAVAARPRGPPTRRRNRRTLGGVRMTAHNAERGKQIVDSGRHAPPRGEHLGTITHWGLDVYKNSPQAWKDALAAEWTENRCDARK